MIPRILFASLIIAWQVSASNVCLAAERLAVVADFEGASVRNVEINEQERTVSFMPGGDPTRGWPCWWFFRIDGITPDEEITLRLHGSDATVGQEKPVGSVLGDAGSSELFDGW